MRLSGASPLACKPMRPAGWKRARMDRSAYPSESETINPQSLRGVGPYAPYGPEAAIQNLKSEI